MRIIVAVLCAALLVLCFAGEARAHPNVPSPYAKLVPQLRARTFVPLYLPGSSATGSLPLYAIADRVERNGYTVTVSAERGCFADACYYATIDGDAKTSASPRLSGTPIPLPNIAAHVVGYFNKFRCAAACGASTITWDFRGYRYAVGVKAGRLSDVAMVAKRMVAVIP